VLPGVQAVLPAVVAHRLEPRDPAARERTDLAARAGTRRAVPL
jgi:hypothetical protein